MTMIHLKKTKLMFHPPQKGRSSQNLLNWSSNSSHQNSDESWKSNGTPAPPENSRP